MKINLLAVLFLLVVMACSCESKTKTFYVDTIQLFKEFQMTKDMEKEDKKVLNFFEVKVDSMEQQLKMNKKLAESSSFRKSYVQLKEEYENNYAQSNKRINDAVWERLNPIIQDFGKEQEVDLIIGANGMGTVIYANKERSLTEDLIKYANAKYTNEK